MQGATEDCETVQQYISMLFDQLPPLSPLSPSSSDPLLQQLTKYGRKIIELSQQSTFQYRNQHFLSRHEVQQEMGVVHRLVTGEESTSSFDKMVRDVIDKLQWERKSIASRLPESRYITPIELKSQEQRSRCVLEEEKANLKQSRPKSKHTNKANTVKQVLLIKNCFQREENSIRDFFDRISKMLELHKVSASSLKFSRAHSENSNEKIIDLVRSSTQDNSKNIQNLAHLVETLHQNLHKRLRNEGAAQGRVEVYLSEVKRLEQVYSYSISKILENVNSIKSLMKEDPPLSSRHLDSIEEISHKLYSLYPTSEHFQNLSVPSKGINEARSFGVQVNLSKAMHEKKVGTETYRLQIRLFQLLQKFQRSIKFRKSVELKELQKLFQTLRQAIPQSKIASKQEVSYQEEFRKVIDLYDRKQKEFSQSSHKKYKKLEKRAQQLENIVEELEKKLVASGQQHEQEKKKLSKKIDHEHSQLKKISGQKAHLEANVTEMLKQIERMREEVRRQVNDETLKRKQLQSQKEDLLERTETTTEKLRQSMDELKIEKERIFEERSIYRQKIELTDKELEEQKELSAGLRLELQTVIGDHHKLRNQVAQMSIIYEQKIKEVEEMIESISQLQQIKSTQQKQILELKREDSLAKERIEEQAQNISEYLCTIDQFGKENQNLRKQIEHWKDEGKLTDSDLRTLKEEVDKVNSAYLQSEALLESARQQLTQNSEEKQKIFKQKLKASRLVEDLESQLHSLKTRYQALELSERDMKDEFYHKCQQIARTSKQCQQLKAELMKSRKEMIEERNCRAKSDQELRQLRQDFQSKREAESAEQGKRKIEFENLRIDLRKKNEQLQKQQDCYQEKIGIMQKRIAEMEERMGQKQLLSRLMQHSSQ